MRRSDRNRSRNAKGGALYGQGSHRLGSGSRALRRYDGPGPHQGPDRENPAVRRIAPIARQDGSTPRRASQRRTEKSTSLIAIARPAIGEAAGALDRAPGYPGDWGEARDALCGLPYGHGADTTRRERPGPRAQYADLRITL